MQRATHKHPPDDMTPTQHRMTTTTTNPRRTTLSTTGILRSVFLLLSLLCVSPFVAVPVRAADADQRSNLPPHTQHANTWKQTNTQQTYQRNTADALDIGGESPQRLIPTVDLAWSPDAADAEIRADPILDTFTDIVTSNVESSIPHGTPFTLTASVRSGSVTPLFGTMSLVDGGAVIASHAVTEGITKVNFDLRLLSIGVHRLQARFDASSAHSSSLSSILSVSIVGGVATQITLRAASSDDVTVDKPVTFIATVRVDSTQTSALPTGVVEFYYRTVVLGSVPLSPSLTVEFTTGFFTGGTYDITAVYTGDHQFRSSRSPVLNQVVSVYVSSVTLASSSGSVVVGSSLTLTATVTSGSALAGSVTFFDADRVLGSAPVLGSSVAVLSSSIQALGMGIGFHSITCQFTGDQRTRSSNRSNTIGITVIGKSKRDDQTSSDDVSNSTPVVEAVQSSLPSIARASIDSPVRIEPAATSISLFVPVSSATFGSPIPITARVVSGDSRQLSGRITFLVGDRPLTGGIKMLSMGENSVTIPLPRLAIGKHEIHVKYSGDAMNLPSETSVPTMIEIVADPNNHRIIARSQLVGMPMQQMTTTSNTTPDIGTASYLSILFGLFGGLCVLIFVGWFLRSSLFASSSPSSAASASVLPSSPLSDSDATQPDEFSRDESPPDVVVVTWH